MSEFPTSGLDPQRDTDERDDDGYFQDMAEEKARAWVSRRDTANEARHYHYPENGDLPA